jgi:hypothetical protein
MDGDMGKDINEFMNTLTDALRKAAEDSNRFCIKCGQRTHRIANGYEARTGKKKFILRCPQYIWWRFWDRHANVKLPF